MSYKILLIDDDKDDREFFLDALSCISNNVELIALENGISLTQDLSEGKIAIPDLIFLDINIPEMNGWACLSLLKNNEQYRSIPIIMYSTSSHKEEAEKAKNAGALSFLSKPFEFKELKAALTEVTDHLERGTLAELPSHSKRFY